MRVVVKRRSKYLIGRRYETKNSVLPATGYSGALNTVAVNAYNTGFATSEVLYFSCVFSVIFNRSAFELLVLPTSHG